MDPWTMLGTCHLYPLSKPLYVSIQGSSIEIKEKRDRDKGEEPKKNTTHTDNTYLKYKQEEEERAKDR